MALLGFTSGAPCGGQSSFRLTLCASSWASSVSCWRSTLSKFNAVGWTQKPSSAVPGRPLGLKEQKVSSGVGVRYLYQAGKLEGGRRRATDPVWSLEVYRLGRSVTKPDEPVLYYLQGDDAPQRGFVREDRLRCHPTLS